MTSTEAQPTPVVQEPQSAPAAPLSPARVFWYSLASLGCGMFFAFNNFVLPLFLRRYTTDARLLGLMGSSHSIEGAVIQPLVGGASDRYRSRYGRRRPFMLAFFPLACLALIVTPAASALPAAMRLGGVVLCVFLFTVFYNIAYDPYRALMPDITPEAQRGRVTGVWSLVGVIGQVGVVFLPIPLEAKFAIVAVVLFVTVLLTCWKTPERDTSHDEHAARSGRIDWRARLAGFVTLRQASKGLAVFFLSGVGIGAVLPNLTLFVKTITHCTDHQAEMMPAILMATTAAAVLPCGWLADRLGPKRVLLLSLALIAVASLGGLVVQTLSQVGLALLVAGLGNAALSAASYPLMTDIVPGREVGFYTGLLSTMESMAQPITVVVTGTLINHGTYRVIFGVCALSMVLGMAALAALDPVRGRAEVAQRDAELDSAL